MIYLLFGIALTLSAVAEWYAIVGLMAIFAASPISIAIMGALLGASKLVIASWLYRNWEEIPILMRGYFVVALTILMILTSMGIFGYLSKAHSDQSLVSGDALAKVAIYDEKIKTAKENIEVIRKQLKQMDEAVDQVMARSTDEKGADKSNAIRKSQQRDRVALAKEIETNQKLIATLNDEVAPLRAEIRKVEAEVGPIKYIAALIYDNPTGETLESAVRILIIMIVSVFDPLAVLLLIAANWQLKRSVVTKPVKKEEPLDPLPVIIAHQDPPQEVQEDAPNVVQSLEIKDEFVLNDGVDINFDNKKGVNYDSLGRRVTP